MNDSYMGGFNNPLSRGSSLSRERLLVDADRLFSIDWLIRRLLIEIQGSLTPEAIAQHHKLFSTLRQQPDMWFAWQMLRAHHASLAKVEEFKQMFPEGRRLIEALNEEREDTIKKFMRFVPSKRWDSLRDDDRSWREYARLLYPMKDKNALIEQEFFQLVDYICVLTDGLCGRWNQLTPVSDEADSSEASASAADLTNYSTMIRSVQYISFLQLCCRSAGAGCFSRESLPGNTNAVYYKVNRVRRAVSDMQRLSAGFFLVVFGSFLSINGAVGFINVLADFAVLPPALGSCR